MMIRNRYHFALLACSMLMLSPDGAGGGGMAQPSPASPEVPADKKTPVDEKPQFLDNDFTPAAMAWRAEHGKKETKPTSTNHEAESGGATAASAGLPQGIEDETDEDELKEKKDSLEPAPTHFSHVGMEASAGEAEKFRDEYKPQVG